LRTGATGLCFSRQFAGGVFSMPCFSPHFASGGSGFPGSQFAEKRKTCDNGP
jgi:hypothetical protein